jgi:hypothetical protein
LLLLLLLDFPVLQWMDIGFNDASMQKKLTMIQPTPATTILNITLESIKVFETRVLITFLLLYICIFVLCFEFRSQIGDNESHAIFRVCLCICIDFRFWFSLHCCYLNLSV